MNIREVFSACSIHTKEKCSLCVCSIDTHTQCHTDTDTHTHTQGTSVRIQRALFLCVCVSIVHIQRIFLFCVCVCVFVCVCVCLYNTYREHVSFVCVLHYTTHDKDCSIDGQFESTMWFLNTNPPVGSFFG